MFKREVALAPAQHPADRAVRLPEAVSEDSSEHQAVCRYPLKSAPRKLQAPKQDRGKCLAGQGSRKGGQGYTLCGISPPIYSCYFS